MEDYVKDRNYENDDVGSQRMAGICAAVVVVQSENDVYDVKLRFEDSDYSKTGVTKRQQVPTTKNKVVDPLSTYV